MENFINFYKNIPLRLDPIAFKIGFFQIGWYGLSYLAAFLVIYRLLIYRMRKDSKNPQILNLKFKISKQFLISKSQNYKKIPNTKYQILNTFFLYAIPGVLVGGRLGYVLFYNFSYYLKRPIEIISPYDFSNHLWTGIHGMSYHGGLLAVILITVWLCRPHTNYGNVSKIKNKNEKRLTTEKSLLKKEIGAGVNFWDFSDFIVPAIPAGYFFGRIGNFLNGELYGRITNSFWGMYFFDGNHIFLRYPSQLIEAFLEGLLVFAVLWIFRNSSFLKGKILFSYLFLYGLARFLAEFFREPDNQIGYISGFLTLGQIFSLLMIFAGLFLFIWKRWYNKTYNYQYE